MHSEIVNSALEKTKELAKKNDGVVISTTKASEDLSIILYDEYNVKYSDRSLRDVANKVIDLSKPKVLDALCKFLGYENYTEYIKRKNISSDSKQINIFSPFIKYILIGLLALSILIMIISANQQRWMVWDNNHYVEVKFNTHKYSLRQLKIYKEERIKYFKKIEANCDVEYFDKSGKPKIWYGKNNKKELEIFTSLGLHPETGKTLKPISKYMIKKYFCSDYE